MRRTVGATAVAVCIAAASVPAQSQTPSSTHDSSRTDSSVKAKTLDAMVVTASRRLQRVSDAPVTTEVISRADVERSGAQDLNTLLTQYVGVQPDPAVAATGGVKIEGLSSERVLLLIDGQPMTGRIDGELDLSRVPAWMIDHVEVIKGPLSTLYGSAAMGGVINVVTSTPLVKTPVVIASVNAGSQGRFDANAMAAGGLGGIHGVVGFGRRQDDVQAGRSSNSNAESNRWDGNGKVHWMDDAASVALDASLFAVREDQRWQNGLLYYFSNNDQNDARLSVTSRGFALTGYYSRFDHLSRQATLPRPVTDSGDASTETLARVEATYTRALSYHQTIDAGVDVDRAALSTSRILGRRRTNTAAEPYAQYTIDAGQLTLVPGVRLSYSDQWGTHFTPKLATLYRVGRGFALRASTGAGYRAPDFKELYITFLNENVGYVVHGNPDLKPETSVNGTAAIEWTGDGAFVRVQGYANRFSQFIESVQASDLSGMQQFTYGNVADGVTRGVDVDAGWSRGWLSVDGSVGYLDAYDRATHRALLGTVPRSYRLNADVTLPASLRGSVTGLYWSKAPSSEAGAATPYRAAFTRIDARLARTFARGIGGQIGVTNLFAAAPANWPGSTGRRWYIGATVSRELR